MSHAFYYIDRVNPLLIHGTLNAQVERIHRTIGDGIIVVFQKQESFVTSICNDNEVHFNRYNHLLTRITGEEPAVQDDAVIHTLSLASAKVPRLGVTTHVSQIALEKQDKRLKLTITGPFAMALCAGLLQHVLTGLEAIDLDAMLLQVAYPTQFREYLSVWYADPVALGIYFNDFLQTQVKDNILLNRCFNVDNLFRALSGMSAEKAWTKYIGAAVGDVMLCSTSSSKEYNLSMLAIKYALARNIRKSVFLEARGYDRKLRNNLAPIDRVSLGFTPCQGVPTYHGSIIIGRKMMEFSAWQKTPYSQIQGYCETAEPHLDRKDVVFSLSDRPLERLRMRMTSTTVVVNKRKGDSYVHHYLGDFESIVATATVL